jgi:hypothetical protein
VLSVEGVADNVPRVHCSVWDGHSVCCEPFIHDLVLSLHHLLHCLGQDLSLDQFVHRYERPRIPVVINGLTEDWPGKWTVEDLLERFGQHKFKVIATVQFRCGLLFEGCELATDLCG